MDYQQLDDNILEDLYSWIDKIPLSRPKRDLKRDFADGVLVAEVIKHFVPSIVETHNYTSALAINKKITNWNLLNRKVFRKLGFEVNDDVVKNIAECQPYAVEQFLIHLRRRLENPELGSKTPEGSEKSPRSCFRKTASTHLIQTSSRTKTTPAKTCESESIPSGHVTSPVGAMLAKQSFGSPGALPGDAQLMKILEEKDNQMKMRDETIEVLEVRVHRLEQLLQLKDIRIEDLKARLNDERKTSILCTRLRQRIA